MIDDDSYNDDDDDDDDGDYVHYDNDEEIMMLMNDVVINDSVYATDGDALIYCWSTDKTKQENKIMNLISKRRLLTDILLLLWLFQWDNTSWVIESSC